jgi:hypothetical protein
LTDLGRRLVARKDRVRRLEALNAPKVILDWTRNLVAETEKKIRDWKTPEGHGS